MKRISFAEFKRLTHHKPVLLDTAWGGQGLVSRWIEKFYSNKEKYGISLPGHILGKESLFFMLDETTFASINLEHKTQTLFEVLTAIPEEVRIQMEASKISKAADLKKKAEERTLRSAISYLEYQKVRYEGQIMTMKAWLDEGMKNGFVHLSEKKRGVAPVWHLANAKGVYWLLRRKEEMIYVEHVLGTFSVAKAA